MERERLLQWAQILAHDWESMKQVAAQCVSNLTGILRIGAIPTTLAIAPLFSEPYQHDYPGVNIKLMSLCAEELVRQLDSFELDLGLTYLEDPCLKGFIKLPLYRERHVLLAYKPDSRLMNRNLNWTDIADLPLCLLTPNMQNRRLIYAVIREADVIPNVMLETDSILALYAHVRSVELYSIVPHSLLHLFEMRQEVTAITGSRLENRLTTQFATAL